jgi:hypothetical protein
VLPPSEFVTALVKLTMVTAAERHRELVAYFAPERALLSESKMVRIRRAAPASQTGLGAYELQMVPIAQPERFVERGDGLLSSGGEFCACDRSVFLQNGAPRRAMAVQLG